MPTPTETFTAYADGPSAVAGAGHSTSINRERITPIRAERLWVRRTDTVVSLHQSSPRSEGMIPCDRSRIGQNLCPIQRSAYTVRP